ncbi:Single-stranded-DNA-specific exonuclease recJ [uncultured Roseburia sp.]|uniref:Single-stranded-DNA-specific exonuclease RecJ n=1 Tax=Brotonthovivens ammoniilytica TaxID=2981725 RepID=A0ABT2TLJ5_9FIRM|nr:single-stranded-DNA-specific exonuclease RecJ [Brotonthovivens ammoniilytica]MCU6763083.1 single-stranded-DNA-specific exonuclease RecJ [Brotonthovivens ammoniilytica]SCJ02680.1 Single-stranded-DNA-specific exonuclease recJ [uncultured Roseburia sp.]
MEEKWVVAGKHADFQAIGKEFGIDPVIARVIRNRNLTQTEQIWYYLNGRKEDLYDPHLMKDVVKAAKIIRNKINSGKKIRIIGDYDIDGVQASYILLKALRRCGARVDIVIPDRMKDGYGINEHLITQAEEQGIDTILTCDNGISAIEPIHMAKQLGMTVVVTDHHDIPYREEDGAIVYLSTEADAVVNPKQQECRYPFKGLCGASVAYKFVQVLYEVSGINPAEADIFIENAGFATVGDVMDLQDENRILVKLGLEMLNHTSNPGMKALILQNKLTFGSIKAYHIGFKIGPCLNASGRLDTARRSLKLLLCEDEIEAAKLASELTALNEERKDMTVLAVEEARGEIQKKHMQDDKVLVVFLPDCHESLAGIVAGRLREAYHRPALVITRGEQGAKGSGRSIECYSMYEELNKCRELFTGFGGHPMAAGFSLPEENIELLRQCLNRNAKLSKEDLIPKIVIDVPMPVDYITKKLILQLEQLEPFGKSNEKPVFADHNLEICSLRILGKDQNVVKMNLLSQHGSRIEGVYFGDPKNLELSVAQKYGNVKAEGLLSGRHVPGIRMHMTYYPDINCYQGTESLQIKVTGFC